MLRARLEVCHKLKKTLGEIDAIPHAELMLHVALLITKGEERKRAMEKGRKGR